MLHTEYTRLREKSEDQPEDEKFIPVTTVLWNKVETVFHKLILISSTEWNSQYSFTFYVLWLLTTLQLCRFISNAYVAYDWNSRVATVWIDVLDAISEFPGDAWTQYIISCCVILSFYVWMFVAGTTHRYLHWNVPVYFLTYLLKWIPSFLFIPLLLPHVKIVFPCLTYSQEAYTINPFFTDTTCWELSHIGFSILSILLMVSFVPLCFGITLIFFNSQIPKAEQWRDNHVSARVNNYPEAYLVFVKTVLLILFVSSNSDSWRIPLSFILTAGGLALVLVYVQLLPFWEDLAQTLYVLQGMVCAWTGVVAFLMTAFDDATGTGMLFFAGLPLLCISAPILLRYRMYVLQNLNEHQVTQPHLLELKARYFIRRYYKYLVTLGDIYVEPTAEVLQKKAEHLEQLERVLALGTQRFPQSVDLHCFLAQLYTTVQYNRVLAYRAIRLCEDNYPDFAQRYIIRSLNAILVAATTQEQSGEVADYIEFQSRINHVQATTASAMQYLVQFWTELLKSAPNIDMLAQIGEYARAELTTAIAHYERLLTLNPNSVPILRAYGMLCMEITGETEKALLMFDRADEVEQEKRTSAMDLNYGKFLNVLDTHLSLFEDRNAILSISVSPDSMGIIQSVNSSLLRYFGYTQETDLVGKSVNVLIPEPIRSAHDPYIERYLIHRKSNVVNNVRLVLGVHYLQHLVPCIMHVRWSNEASGKMIAVLQPLVNAFEMCCMVDPSTHKITYATYNVHSIYGFSKRDVFGRQVHLADMIPTLRDEDGDMSESVMGELFTARGHKCVAHHAITTQRFNLHAFAHRIDVLDDSVIFVRAQMSHIQEDEERFELADGPDFIPDDTDEYGQYAMEAEPLYGHPSPSPTHSLAQHDHTAQALAPPASTTAASPALPKMSVDTGFVEDTQSSFLGNSAFKPMMLSMINKARTKAMIHGSTANVHGVTRVNSDLSTSSSQRGTALQRMSSDVYRSNHESLARDGTRGHGQAGRNSGEQDSKGSIVRRGSLSSMGSMGSGIPERPTLTRSNSGKLNISGELNSGVPSFPMSDLSLRVPPTPANNSTSPLLARRTLPSSTTSASAATVDAADVGLHSRLSQTIHALDSESLRDSIDSERSSAASRPDSFLFSHESHTLAPVMEGANDFSTPRPMASPVAAALRSGTPTAHSAASPSLLPLLNTGTLAAHSSGPPAAGTPSFRMQDVNTLSGPSLEYAGLPASPLRGNPRGSTSGAVGQGGVYSSSLAVPVRPMHRRSPSRGSQEEDHAPRSARVSGKDLSTRGKSPIPGSSRAQHMTAEAANTHVDMDRNSVTMALTDTQGKGNRSSFVADQLFRRRRRALKMNSQALLQTAINNDDMLTVRKLIWMKFFAFFMILLVIAASITLFIVANRFLARAELLVTNVYRSSVREAYMVDTLLHNKIYQLMARNPTMVGVELVFLKMSSMPLELMIFGWSLREVVEYSYALRRDQALAQFEQLSLIIDQTPSSNDKLLRLRVEPVLPAWELEGLTVKETAVSLRDGVSRFSAYLRHSAYMRYMFDVQDPGFFYAMSNAMVNLRLGMQLNTQYTMEEMQDQHDELIYLVIAIFAVSALSVIFVAMVFVQPLVKRIEESRNRVLFIFQSVPPTIRRSLRKKAYQMYGMMNTEKDILDLIGADAQDAGEQSEEGSNASGDDGHGIGISMTMGDRKSTSRRNRKAAEASRVVQDVDQNFGFGLPTHRPSARNGNVTHRSGRPAYDHSARGAPGVGLGLNAQPSQPSVAMLQRYQQYISARHGEGKADRWEDRDRSARKVPGEPIPTLDAPMITHINTIAPSATPTHTHPHTPTPKTPGGNPLKQRNAKVGEAVMAARKRDQGVAGTASAPTSPMAGALRGDVCALDSIADGDAAEAEVYGDASSDSDFDSRSRTHDARDHLAHTPAQQPVAAPVAALTLPAASNAPAHPLSSRRSHSALAAPTSPSPLTSDEDTRQMDLERKSRKSLLSRRSVQILALRYLIYFVILCAYFSFVLYQTMRKSDEVENSMRIMMTANKRNPSMQMAYFMASQHILFDQQEMKLINPYDPTVYSGPYYTLGQGESLVAAHAHYTLQFGSKEAGIARVQQDAELDHLMNGDLCSFTPERADELLPGFATQYKYLFTLCPVYESGLLRKGLLHALQFVTEVVDAMLAAPPKAMIHLLFGGMPVEGVTLEYSMVLLDYLVRANEIFHDYLFPLLQVCGALYRDMALKLYSDFNFFFLVTFIACVAFNILAYWVLFHPSSHALSVASNQTKAMMLLLPPQIVKHVAQLQQYINDYISME